VAGTAYLASGEMRAKQMQEWSQWEDKEQQLQFMRRLWDLTELKVAVVLNRSPLVSAMVAVNEVFPIGGEEVLSVPKEDGSGSVDVSLGPVNGAAAGAPRRTVQVRHITNLGEAGDACCSSSCGPGGARGGGRLARGLIIHFHGGGFVAQSSASHEVYLRVWAEQLNTPILSVDYGLAPEHPYPSGLDECYYAYCWALTFARERLQTVADKVAFVGDSAGANLVAAVALRAASEGIRPPDGIVMAYPALHCRVEPSPSRMLSVIDPLLNLTALQLCISAYTGGQTASDAAQFPPIDAFLSPLDATDEQLRSLPVVYLMAAALDPLLDDSVLLAQRLAKLGHPLHYCVVPGVSHGFLNMAFMVGQPLTSAIEQCALWLAQIL